VTTRSGSEAAPLAADQILAIAQADAARAYRDLTPYRVTLALEDDGWHVDYDLKSHDLKNRARKGGGPHYVIDAVNGQIRAKRSEQ
jgi:hypothetical protein